MAELFVSVKPSVIVRFVNTMEAYVGSFARDSFYKIVKQAVFDHFTRSRKKTDLKAYLKEFELENATVQPLEDLVLVEIKDSAFARDSLNELGRFGRPVCLFIAASLAGAQSALAGKPFDCVERKCMGTGEELCQFVIYPAEKKWENIIAGLK